MEGEAMLWTLIVLILLFYLIGGIGFGLGGSLIHLLLLVVAVLAFIQILTGRQTLPPP
jgi:hypothetical protein